MVMVMAMEMGECIIVRSLHKDHTELCGAYPRLAIPVQSLQNLCKLIHSAECLESVFTITLSLSGLLYTRARGPGTIETYKSLLAGKGPRLPHFTLY